MTTLLLDLETLPETATVSMDLDNPPGWDPGLPPDFSDRKPPTNWKDKALIKEWWVKEHARQAEILEGRVAADAGKARDWYGKHSLDPMQLRIACIGWGIVGEEPQVIECFEDEKAGLELLREITKDRQPDRVVAHHGHGFDFPVIQLRAVKHGLFGLAHSFHQEKPWEGALLDTCLLWPVTKFRGQPQSSANVNAICAFLGIDRPDNPIDGKDVLQAYVDGRQDEIVAHCRADIRDLGKVWEVVRQIRGL